MFWEKNKIWVGILVGLLVPFIGLAVLELLLEQLDELVFQQARNRLSESFKDRTLYLIAIIFNIIPFQLYNKQKKILSMRGMVIATTIYAIAWMVLFVKEIL
ncbi:MAG: hypothetical protein ACO388_03600 [Saprospiraceae bacterium]|jgi:hypothetical protein